MLRQSHRKASFGDWHETAQFRFITNMPQPCPRNHRFLMLATLYISQAVPLGFFVVALPAILRREGLGLELVGVLSALALPWLIKFLWAPLVDRFSLTRSRSSRGRSRGHFKSWILPLQILCIAAAVAIAQLDVRDITSTSLPWLVAAGAVFMFASATQDIATDGLAVGIVEERDRGRANGVQVGGYYLGQIAGGGLLLVIYASYGWTAAVLSMAGLLSLALLPVWSFREAPREVDAERSANAKIDYGAIRRFVRRPGGRAWAVILITFRAGEGASLAMLSPMLVDSGLDLDFIGVTVGVAASIASLAGAAVAGFTVARLGRKRALLLFAAVQAIALLGYLLPAYGVTETMPILTIVATAAFASGLATTALYTNMMDRCDPGTPATDFTLQQSLAAFGPMIGAIGSGFLAKALGYPSFVLICVAATALVVLLVAVCLSPQLAATPRTPCRPDSA